MSKKSGLLILVLLFFTAANSGFTQDFKADQPFVLTSAGQSADVLMVKILAQKSGIKFLYDKLIKAGGMKNYTTLVFVSGGSSKGLGAANINKKQESERIRNLINTAKKKKIKIITMHVGGKVRRGKLSDEFNKLTAENSDCLIVVKGGNEDKFFSTIAEEKKIPIYQIAKILNAGDILKSIFNK